MLNEKWKTIKWMFEFLGGLVCKLPARQRPAGIWFVMVLTALVTLTILVGGFTVATAGVNGASKTAEKAVSRTH